MSSTKRDEVQKCTRDAVSQPPSSAFLHRTVGSRLRWWREQFIRTCTDSPSASQSRFQLVRFPVFDLGCAGGDKFGGRGFRDGREWFCGFGCRNDRRASVGTHGISLIVLVHAGNQPAGISDFLGVRFGDDREYHDNGERFFRCAYSYLSGYPYGHRTVGSRFHDQLRPRKRFAWCGSVGYRRDQRSRDRHDEFAGESYRHCVFGGDGNVFSVLAFDRAKLGAHGEH